MIPGSPTSRQGVCLNDTSPAHSNPFSRSDSLRSYSRTPSTMISRTCRRNSIAANELPVFLAVTQPSGPLIQCFVTSATAASCASRSMPDTCPATPPPVSAESDLLHPGVSRANTSATAITHRVLFLIMEPPEGWFHSIMSLRTTLPMQRSLFPFQLLVMQLNCASREYLKQIMLIFSYFR